MNIVIVTSEAVPFAKTGGLADVCGVLPIKLAELGHTVSVVMPAFRQVYSSHHEIRPTDIGFQIPIAGRHVAGRVLHTKQQPSGVDYYFIDQPQYYDRPALYGDANGDYRDNCERFAFFCRAAMQAIDRLQIPCDIVHSHDWPSGLVSAYVSTGFGDHAWTAKAATVFTIHNLAYQGRFWRWDMGLTGLDWKYFNFEQLEFYGDLNLLKSGLVFSDKLTTVSPRYAEEIQHPDLGFGLDTVLRNRAEDLVGIVNGVDYEAWDPSVDPHLPMKFGIENWQVGKRSSREVLATELGMTFSPDLPLVGLVGRLADQKGWDLVIPLLRKWVSLYDVQWVVLGTGDQRYHDQLEELADHAPHRLTIRLEFSDRIAHLIEAASDMFLMPSRFEPCGLNQLYSLRYGAVPIVHATGGLADTVTGVSESSLADGTATGFSFETYSIETLEQCVQSAIQVFREKPEQWAQLVRAGMQQDWSWRRSARQYEQVYQQAIQQKQASNP